MRTVPPDPAQEPRPLVYVAGPYTRGGPDDNVRNAIDAADRLLEAGWIPVVPHLTFLWGIRSPKPVETWYAYDLHLLARCHAIVRLPGESTGADAEVEWARRNHVHVFRDLEEACAQGKPEAWTCARCGRPMLIPQQGGPDTPLCDECHGDVGAYGRGWWAGFDGYGAHESEADDEDADYYQHGHDDGARTRGDDPHPRRRLPRRIPGEEPTETPPQVLA